MSRPRSEANRAGHDARPVLPPGKVTRTPPKSLGDVGKAVWKAIVKQGGPYQDTDAFALTRYCELHDRRAELLTIVDSEGYITKGSMGQTVVHPALKAVSDIESHMSRLEAVLCLTPESRARLGLGADIPDELTDFLSRG